MTQRADMALVARGLFPSRAKAREAIEAGLVRRDGILVTKPSEPVDEAAKIEAEAPYPWVSRGGVKLAAALEAFGILPEGKRALDIGASTGGFADVLLSRGAAHVTCVDVGSGQLHEKIARDPRVTAFEKFDARKLTLADLPGAPELIVCDVSFISLALVLPPVLALAGPGAEAAILIKPQFEAGPEQVRKGFVRDALVREKICEKIKTLVAGLGWRVLGVVPSPIHGGDGNVEFLLGARRA
ncbi:23S rRNA (cytidine1920-2'-O)/16S rRNA (cytidine1409-2'-O)-methyltransferase [Rhodoblastus acidophilus]|uniref:TlyA family RNA methyltransferase n=1 Tax=Rhodoblastus acidophilus TaxID=1074 RepID=UPI002224980A|nr:TlyA family RNA methyltransferase [Rhodoblastus acidophilus]MCW2285651.1 23S rRNA (cytidine1920-2'-O)/16S rRNA (cytidine1409-2'-O)-methyltransferase [Rhodoblastus acidophilus]MCW2334591.1 23S rRNA (cytidine1920-2'-O)/16S rRNA (cytidine1409-2'-O)-methyltransferase [Rhodoblastus acidophilus]